MISTTAAMICDFPAAILKGLIEYSDGTWYFGSTLAWKSYQRQAIERGWLDADGQPTDLGRHVYETSGLADLPRTGRAYAWDWTSVRLPEEDVMSERRCADRPSPVTSTGKSR